MTQDQTANTPPGSAAQSAGLQIQDWRIWYLFAGYVSTDVPDLRRAASRLLRAKFGMAAVLARGDVAFRSQDRVEWGRITESDSIGSASTEIKFTSNIPDHLRLPIVSVALARSAARNIFSFHAPRSDEMLSVDLPDLTLYFGPQQAITLKVTLSLFQSGIVIVSLLSTLTSDGIPLEKFIDEHVNLSQREISAFDIDSDLAFLLADAHLREKGLGPRTLLSLGRFGIPLPRRLWMPIVRERMHRVIVRESSQLVKEEAFPGEQCVLPAGRLRIQGSPNWQLEDLACQHIQGLAHALGMPRSGLTYFLLGEPDEPTWRGYWAGSSGIHLLRFTDQSPSVAENEGRHSESFKWILARTPPHPNHGPLRSDLPKNMRVFDDYALYISETSALSVYSANSNACEIGDGTEANPIAAHVYHHQIEGEFLEYGRMLYMSLLHELEEQSLDWDKIFRIRQRQIQFEIDMSHTGRFGEIRNLLAAGFEARRVPELKVQTQSLLELRESMASVRENRRLTMTGMVLAIVLSLLGLPGAIDFLNAHIAPHVPWMATLGERSLLRIGVLALVSGATIIVVPLVSWLLFKRFHWISMRGRIRRQ